MLTRLLTRVAWSHMLYGHTHKALGTTNTTNTSVHRRRVERASMAVNYVILWRWDEFRGFVRQRRSITGNGGQADAVWIAARTSAIHLHGACVR